MYKVTCNKTTKKSNLMVYPVQSRRRSSKLRYAVILAILLAIAYGIYRIFFNTAPAAPTPPPPAVTVELATVSDIPLIFEYPARLAGSREVEIRARVGGILLKRAYEEGQFVKRGDVLFQIDPAPYEAALAEAQATFTQTASDYKRAATLMKQKALSPREYDQAQALYGAAKAQLETAKINLAFTTVRSPISGYTSEESNSEGTLVTADTTLLTRVTQLDPMYVEFAYPDSEAMMQRQGVADGSITLPPDKMLHVEIISSNGQSYPREGAIRFTDSIISPETGTVSARATVPNKDQSIMPGQFVRVKVKGMTRVQSIGVPERAIMQGPMGTFVYTVTPEGKAAITVVELGLLNNGTQIINKGLNEGDKVITEGMIKVKPDSPVCIDTEENPCGGKKPDAAPAASPKAKE
jgi:membrane fusion protein (multidrug efflux system)